MEKIHFSKDTAKRWGIWATLGLSLIIALLFVVVQIVTAGVMGAVQINGEPTFDSEAFAVSLESFGLFISLSTIATGILCSASIVLFAAIRKGITVKQYLHFSPVPWRVLFRWLGVTIVFAIAIDGLSLLLGRPVIPEFMVTAYNTAVVYSLFWIAIVVAAPLLEELFFRGFLFEGLRESRLGSIGTVIATSVVWAVIHLQYGAFEITQIALLGLMLGIAKLKTRSIYVPMAMHSLINLLATVEVAVLLGMT